MINTLPSQMVIKYMYECPTRGFNAIVHRHIVEASNPDHDPIGNS